MAISIVREAGVQRKERLLRAWQPPKGALTGLLSSRAEYFCHCERSAAISPFSFVIAIANICHRERSMAISSFFLVIASEARQSRLSGARVQKKERLLRGLKVVIASAAWRSRLSGARYRKKRDCFVPRNDNWGRERSVAISVVLGLGYSERRDCFVPRNDKMVPRNDNWGRELSVAISVVSYGKPEGEIASCLAMTRN